MHLLNLGVGFLSGMLGWRNLETQWFWWSLLGESGGHPILKIQQLAGALAVQRIKGNLGKFRCFLRNAKIQMSR